MAPKPKQAKSGIRLNPEYNTSVPNWALEAQYWMPIDGGRPPSIHALRILIWCIDKVTSVYDDEELGVPIGSVLGGAEISFNTIGNANNLRISWSTVQRAMQFLEERRLIRRHRGSSMKEYSYEVINCRKEFKEKKLTTRDGRTIDPTKVLRIKPEPARVCKVCHQPPTGDDPLSGGWCKRCHKNPKWYSNGYDPEEPTCDTCGVSVAKCECYTKGYTDTQFIMEGDDDELA
jgi:hypothetical protein